MDSGVGGRAVRGACTGVLALRVGVLCAVSVWVLTASLIRPAICGTLDFGGDERAREESCGGAVMERPEPLETRPRSNCSLSPAAACSSGSTEGETEGETVAVAGSGWSTSHS